MKKIAFAFIIGFLSIPSAWSVDTVIQGDTMEMLDKGDSILFKGHVILERSSDTVKSEWMETTKARDKVKAKGHVQLDRKLSEGGSIKANGDSGFYNTKNGEGYLLGGGTRAHIIYNQVLSSTLTRTVDVYAQRFDFTQISSTGVATGDVYGRSVDPEKGDVFEFWSDQADMDYGKKIMVLTGRKQPHARQSAWEGDRLIQGDSITFYYDAKKFRADGHAQAVFIDKKKKEKS